MHVAVPVKLHQHHSMRYLFNEVAEMELVTEETSATRAWAYDGDPSAAGTEVEVKIQMQPMQQQSRAGRSRPAARLREATQCFPTPMV